MKNKRNDELKKFYYVKKMFFCQIKSNDLITKKTIRPFWKHLFSILLISIIIFSLSTLNFSFNYEGFKLFWQNMRDFFKFSTNSTYFQFGIKKNLFILSLIFFYKTFSLTLVGTFLGFVLALLTSYFANKNTYKWYSLPIKLLILLLRSFPELLYIYLFSGSKIFSNYLSLLFIYAWFTWLWLHKYFLEIYENIDYSFYFISIKQGNNRIRAFLKEIFSRVSNRFISLFFFSFESNIKWGTIISSLGVFGIGSLIDYANYSQNFTEMGIPIAILFSFLIFLEIIFYFINKYLLQANTKILNSKEYKYLLKRDIPFRSIIKSILFFSIFIYSIIILSKLDYKIGKYGEIKEIFKYFFNPSFINVNYVISSIFIELIPYSTLISFLSFFVTLLLLPLTSRKLFNNKTSIIFKIINTFFRILPVIFIFYLFYPIFNSSLFLLIICLIFHSIFKNIKQINELIDNVDLNIINNFRKQGWNKFWIYTKFIMPYIKKDLISIFLFNFELNIRNLITYSFLTKELTLGNLLNDSLNEKNLKIDEAFGYIWIIFIFIFLSNLIFYFINEILIKQKYWNLLKIIIKNKKLSN